MHWFPIIFISLRDIILDMCFNLLMLLLVMVQAILHVVPMHANCRGQLAFIWTYKKQSQLTTWLPINFFVLSMTTNLVRNNKLGVIGQRCCNIHQSFSCETLQISLIYNTMPTVQSIDLSTWLFRSAYQIHHNFWPFLMFINGIRPKELPSSTFCQRPA